jgi:hypothetical protein
MLPCSFPRRLTVGLLLGSASTLAQPASGAGQTFFAYNNTTRTDFTGIYLVPAGTQDGGPNQALNDKDESLDAGERLTLTGPSELRCIGTKPSIGRRLLARSLSSQQIEAKIG